MDGRMKNAVAVILLSAAALFAQDQPAVSQPAVNQPAVNQPTVSHARASCGSGNIQFEVKTEKADKSHHPAQPAPDKALAYVVENRRAGCFLCDTTTRIGLDGAWVGATRDNSYFSFSVEPGEHHLCADLQFVPSSSETTSLASFTAEAGKTYYFRARLTDQNNSGKGPVDLALDLEPIDSDQGQFLIASYGVSTYRQKK